MMVEEWPHTLLVVMPYELREVAYALGRMARTQLVVALVVSLLKLAMLLVWSMLVVVGLGVR